MDEALPQSAEPVVIGAGQARLVMSHLLSQIGREHVVLDRRETLGGRGGARSRLVRGICEQPLPGGALESWWQNDPHKREGRS